MLLQIGRKKMFLGIIKSLKEKWCCLHFGMKRYAKILVGGCER